MSGSGPQPWHSQILWGHLQALGFEEAPPPPGDVYKFTEFGTAMFEKPNKDAFYVVAYFLFSVLDAVRCKETFRHLWPPISKKQEAEFRKQCSLWLKIISDECGSDFPPVVASIFLSPGGPKFIFLMASFAKYVVLQNIKRDADDGLLFEALNATSKDLETASARAIVGRNLFLQAVHKQGSFINQYEQKAQNLVRQVRGLRAESASLQTQLLKCEYAKTETITDLAQSVRSKWDSVMESLTFLKEEKDVVDSVIKGHVDQYSLDGTDAAVNVPCVLKDAIENNIDKLHIDNIYEIGNLNLVTVVQLLNESLKILIHERSQLDHKGLKLDLKYILEKAAHENEVLSRLRHLRDGIKHECLVSVNESIVEKQRGLYVKWEKELGQAPFHAINLNRALEFESSAVTLSFSPAPEDLLKNSVFCRYPPSFQDSAILVSQRNAKENRELTPSVRFNSRMQLPRFNTPGCKSNRRLSEMGSYGGTPKLTPYGLKKGRVDDKTRHHDAFMKARQQLVEQAVELTAEPESSTPGRKVEMDRLLEELYMDPFISQKQLPRTPESLISDVRNFWREAIQTVDVSELHEEHVQMTTPPPDSTNGQISSHGGKTNSTMTGLSLPRDSLKNSSLDCANYGPSGESLDDQTGGYGALTMTKGWVNGAMPFSAQGLKTPEQIEKKIFLDGNQMQTNILNSPDRKDNLQLPVFGQGISEHSTLSWDLSQRLGGGDELDSCEVVHFGLPYQTHDSHLNISSSLQTGDVAVDCRPKGEDPQINLIDLQAVRSRLEVLKRARRNNSRELEDLYISPHKNLVKRKSASCLLLQYVENDDPIDFSYLETSAVAGKNILPSSDEQYASIEQEELHILELKEYDDYDED